MTNQKTHNCLFCSLHYDGGNFCAKLSQDEIRDLNTHSKTIKVKRGETLPEDQLDRWPILTIESGVLSLQHLLHDGRRTIAAFFMRGDLLDLRGTNARNRGNLVALKTTKLCRLSNDVFERILKTNEAARSVAWKCLTDQAFRATSHASDLAKKQALEKLASFIFECRNRTATEHPKDHAEIPVRRRDLAEYLGMQPETVSRSFKELEDRNIIRVSDLSILKILDTPALRRIANGGRNPIGVGGHKGPDYKILSASS